MENTGHGGVADGIGIGSWADADPARSTRRRFLKKTLLVGGGLATSAFLGRTRLSIPVAYGQDMVWLNIRVDRRIASQGQYSWASAWTSSDREGRIRVAVKRLHLVLDSHDHQQKDCDDCDYLRIDESHAGSENVKARARAWCEGPDISPLERSA